MRASPTGSKSASRPSPASRVELDGKRAIVTGGGTGVGRETALELARRGCSVLINYSRSRAEAEATASEIEALGVGAVAMLADVADDAACRAMVGRATDGFGGLDVLVNNAGTTRFIEWNDLEAVRTEDWERIFAVNLRGVFQCIRAARTALAGQGGGEIVNVASLAGISGGGSSIPYATSKAAVIALTQGLAPTLGPEIRINAVAPGFITGRWLGRGLGDAYEPVKDLMSQRAPAGRVCDPSDVAAAIVALIAGSDMVSGQTVVVDGGVHAVGPLSL